MGVQFTILGQPSNVGAVRVVQLKYVAPWVVYSFECNLLGRILIQSDTRTGFWYNNII